MHKTLGVYGTPYSPGGSILVLKSALKCNYAISGVAMVQLHQFMVLPQQHWIPAKTGNSLSMSRIAITGITMAQLHQLLVLPWYKSVYTTPWVV